MDWEAYIDRIDKARSTYLSYFLDQLAKAAVDPDVSSEDLDVIAHCFNVDLP